MTDERTLGHLVADATSDLSDLVRAEVALAKAELRVDARNAGLAGGMFAAAGYLGLLATITAVIAVGYGLVAVGLPAWAAFVIVTVGLVLLAGLLVLVGRAAAQRIGPPEQAIEAARATLAALAPGGGGAVGDAGTGTGRSAAPGVGGSAGRGATHRRGSSRRGSSRRGSSTRWGTAHRRGDTDR